MMEKSRSILRNFKNFFSVTRQVLQGEILLDNFHKFRVMCLASAVVHFIFMLCLHAADVDLLFYYNLLIVALYLYMGIVLVSKEQFRKIYAVIYLEFELHSALAALLVGWDWQFMLYTIPLVPAAFYFSGALTEEKNRFYYAAASSGFVMFCYLVVSLAVRQIDPVFDTSQHAGIRIGMMYFNVCIAFSLQFVFSHLFSLESRYLTKVLEKENKNLGHDASYDPLTKLMNRRSMSRLMDEEIKRCENTEERFCIIMTDIDDFKKVNDTYGHDMGDVVLATVARIVMEEVRDGDFTCRWGGEEFLLLIHGNRNDGQIAAERIREHVASELFTTADKQEFSITLTLGVSEYQSGRVLRTLIEAADKKLYFGKSNGKNQVVI